MSFATDLPTGPRPGDLTIREVFVPPWYLPHENLETEVLHSSTGKRLGFTVGDVVPERRWAVGPDGRCVSQQIFEEKLDEWRQGQYRWQIPPKPVPDISFLPVPTVENFVARGEDPADTKRLIDLTAPQHRKALLQKREPVVDEVLLKSPHWKPAPKAEKPDPAAELEALRAKVAELEAKPKKAPRAVELLSCDLCGQEGLKGKNGLRFHKTHKHKDA